MNRMVKVLIIFFFIIFMCYNMAINKKLRSVVNGFNPDIRYLFAVSFIPDRAAFVGFKYGNMSVVFLTVDIDVKNYF